MLGDINKQQLVALLDWYRAMGVDSAAGEIAVDWLARSNAGPGAGFRLARDEEVSAPSDPSHASSMMGQTPQHARQPPPPAQSPARHDPGRSGILAKMSEPPGSTPAQMPQEPRRPPAQAPDAAETAARSAARTAPTLEALGAALQAFNGCGLRATATNLCFYRGAANARLMIIGEAPGRDEDIEGKPFVGRAGQLLDKMLAAIKLGEGDVHITNIVYWRPPGNRTPTPQEAQVCRPFLERQIELVAPDVIVLLGGAAAKHILDVADGIMRIRGRWHDLDFGGRKIRTIATLHPAYLLRTPASKRLAWRDLLAIAAALQPSG